jgi:flagellin
MTVINTNVAASITANALTKNERAMSQAMERLSTGQRINSAGDDAAGLAISSRMTSQINGLNMAVRNANDAISMVQTADGAMIEITNMMQRMRELAVQAASGTTTTSDKTALDTEYSALSAEIQRITQNTQWNGTNLLDDSAGTTGAVDFQVGANATQTVQVDFGNIGSGENTITAAHNSNTVQDITLGSPTTVKANDIITIKVDNTSGTDEGFVQFTIDATDAAAIIADNAHTPVGSAVTIGGTSYTLAMTGTAGAMTLTAGADRGQMTLSHMSVSRGVHGTMANNELLTASAASSAITALDTAIASMNTQRATLGASINRLEYAADNLANVSQNTSASRSRVLDADYASETTELARTQIIQQAATAMLSQANQQAQSILALLK